jgi:hypothetical protein
VKAVPGATVSDKPARPAKPSLEEKAGQWAPAEDEAVADRQLQLALKSLNKELAVKNGREGNDFPPPANSR